MGNQLLIRAYNVGCGDCIYVRIPGPDGGFNILIDCGKKGDTELLKKAIDHLARELPVGSTPEKRRLDLIVATHRHEDHIKGFDSRWFENIEVKNIWLSVAMDPEHPQATGVNALHALATRAMRALTENGQALSPDVEMLASMYGVSNDAADELLMKTLPARNGIEPKFVHSGMKHGLKLPAGTKIHILAPEKDVDHFYLGEELDATLRGFNGLTAALSPAAAAVPNSGAQPANISASDFNVLQSRMLSNALAFAAKESSIQNNLSVVLLIEWKGRRLLFVGDAEWEGEFKAGKHNGSWNVMWEKHRKTHLKKPVDFLKIGHHGSINATPPPASEKTTSADVTPESVYAILDTILPVPKRGKPKAQAIVSTEREFYNPIPECKLLVDIARRVSNTRDYGARLKKKGIDPRSIWATTKAKKNKFFDTYEKTFLNQPQPLRTDLEFVAEGKDSIEVQIPPR
jgi:beta-lactamase superfamily II metal-dependent hydrolase